MAFDIRNLGVLSYTLGFTQWHYKSNNDNITEITQDGYFNYAEDMFSIGDMIIIYTNFNNSSAIRYVHKNNDVVVLRRYS